MKAPDKIYLEKSLSNPDRLHSQWYPNDVIGGGIEYIRKDVLIEFVNKELQESADRLDFRTNKAYAEVFDKLNSI